MIAAGSSDGQCSDRLSLHQEGGGKPSYKKGKKQWNISNSYLKTRNSKANLERKLAAQRASRMLRKRKSLHGELVNSIISNGDVIKLEKLSYKAFQKLFGKSVGKRALLYVRIAPKKQG